MNELATLIFTGLISFGFAVLLLVSATWYTRKKENDKLDEKRIKFLKVIKIKLERALRKIIEIRTSAGYDEIPISSFIIDNDVIIQFGKEYIKNEIDETLYNNLRSLFFDIKELQSVITNFWIAIHNKIKIDHKKSIEYLVSTTD